MKVAMFKIIIRQNVTHQTINFLIACVWFINGMFCKVLNLVPRHQEIVQRILPGGYSGLFTLFIGFAEIIMTVWILSNFKTRLNAWVQISAIGTMNILEFWLVPDLLLWGRMNIVFSALFISVIYFNEFTLKNPTKC